MRSLDEGNHRTAPGRSGSLPAPVTTFIGRRTEIAEITEHLQSARLVTLTGMGGVGKTRLALQVAAVAAADYRHGVWLVNLENLTDESLLWETVSSALGVSHHPSQTIETQLSNYLNPRQLLLVLDNCEHLLDACAALVGRLLGAAPELTILATSRTALDIPGEHVVPVAPLAVPETAEADARRGYDLDVLRAVESVQLFLDRAQAHSPGFELTRENAAAVGQLCARLEGLPLAIELAANRLRSLGVEQILERLEDRFTVLSGSTKTIAPRQRTLRALVDWSYERCTPVQQKLWERLSVFAGPFDLEAAEEVCGGTDLLPESVLDLIDQLVAQSILIAVPSGSRIRYRMLETIREYGAEQLCSTGGHDTYRRRHRDFYLELACSTVHNWCGPNQAALLTRLRAEHQNLRAALDWSLTTPGQARDGLALASALRFHWVVNGMLSEGRLWLTRALAAAPGPTAGRAEGLWVLAWAAILQDDVTAAEAALEECRSVADRIDDRVDKAYAVQMHASAALITGRMTEAIESFDAAVDLHERQNNPTGVLLALFQNIIALTHTGQSQRARATSRRALALSDSYGEQWARSYTLWAIGIEEWQHGSPDEAEAHALAALSIAHSFHDRVCAGLSLDALACIASTHNQHEKSAVLFGVADAVWESLGTTIGAFGLHLAGHHTTCEQGTRRALGDDLYHHYLMAGRQHERASAIPWVLAGLDLGHLRPKSSTTATAPLDRLTRREREVAILLTRGMSNREMANHLVLSLRTIEGHMENILAKLGCASRGQVIALLAASSPND